MEALLFEMVISTSTKTSQLHKQINSTNIDKIEGSSTIEDVENTFTVVDE